MGFRLYLSTSVTVMQIQQNHTDFLFFVVLFCTVLGFTVLLCLPLALTILMTFGGRIRADSVFVALVGFGCWIEGGFSPGQLLKTWTSLTLWPLSSGGWPQVALTFRFTCSIHLVAEGTLQGSKRTSISNAMMEISSSHSMMNNM